jgi:hypothetical protein
MCTDDSKRKSSPIKPEISGKNVNSSVPRAQDQDETPSAKPFDDIGNEQGGTQDPDPQAGTTFA